jgi:exonuclease VII large subunit
MKISYSRLPEEKQQLVLDFQRWAVTTLSKLISEGKVILTDIEQAQIQNNIKETLDFTDEDIDKLFNDFEEKINDFTDKAKDKVSKLHMTMVEDKQRYDSRMQALKDQNYRLINKTIELMNKRLEEF